MGISHTGLCIILFDTELVWKVARYTTAAPVYFSECDNYVDGGVKANDPSAFGLTEIQSFLSRYVACH